MAPNDKFHHVAAVDAAFKGDRFTMAIAHYERDREAVVLDRLAGWQGSKQVPLRLADRIEPDHGRGNGERVGVARVDGVGGGGLLHGDTAPDHGAYVHACYSAQRQPSSR